VARGKEGNRHAEQKDQRTRKRVKERERKKEREKWRTNRKEGRGKRDHVVREKRRAHVHLLFVEKGPRWALPPPNCGLSYKRPMGAPIGHMKAKKPKVVVDLVLHWSLN